MKKISVIIPTYNQGIFIEETLRSILDQNYPALEILVFDGGSSDNTIEILKKYSPFISYWESVPDKGQSDAINKGLQRVSGDVVTWLNSDDLYTQTTLHRVNEVFCSEDRVNCVIGDIEFFRDQITWRKSDKQNILSSELAFILPVIKQPSTFYSAAVVKRMGLLDPKLHYCMDLDWWYRYVDQNGIDGVRIVPDVFSRFRFHNESKTSTSVSKFIHDRLSIFLHYSQVLNDQLSSDVVRGFIELPEKNDLLYNPVNISKRSLQLAISKFLFEVYGTVYIEEDFNRLKVVMNQCSRFDFSEDEKLIISWAKYKDKVSVGSWNYFRLRRKLLHFRGIDLN